MCCGSPKMSCALTWIISGMMWKQTDSLKWQISIVSIEREHTFVTRSLNIQQAVPALFIHPFSVWLLTDWLTGSTFSSYFPISCQVCCCCRYLTFDQTVWFEKLSSKHYSKNTVSHFVRWEPLRKLKSSFLLMYRRRKVLFPWKPHR